MTSEMAKMQDILGSRKVLVVDDEPDSLAIAEVLLSVCGAVVLTANNGSEGLAAAVEHLPMFIISDLSMPEMSGWDMLVKLKESPRTRDIPVIALTAHAMRGDRARAIEAGFHNYLSKPLSPETFIHDLLILLVDIPNIAALMNQQQQ